MAVIACAFGLWRLLERSWLMSPQKILKSRCFKMPFARFIVLVFKTFLIQLNFGININMYLTTGKSCCFFQGCLVCYCFSLPLCSHMICHANVTAVERILVAILVINRVCWITGILLKLGIMLFVITQETKVQSINQCIILRNYARGIMPLIMSH